LRGFCQYGKDTEQGLSQVKATALFELCKPHLPREHLHVLSDRPPSAPYRRNRQVVIWLRDGVSREESNEAAKQWSIALKHSKVCVEGRGVYVVADTDEITKARKRAVAQAKAVILQEGLLTDGWECEPDWAAGCVYLTRDGTEHVLVRGPSRKVFSGRRGLSERFGRT
jgi:hypothetical protein